MGARGLTGATAGLRRWTPEEDATVVALLGRRRRDWKAIRKALPGRSDTAILHRASSLGALTTPRWTAAEVRTLRLGWHEDTERTLRAKLPHHTWVGIWRKAVELGLPRGVPQGFEHLAHAARRTGFDPETLARLLRDQGVAIHAMYRVPGTPTARKVVRRYVDPELVDAAVAAWTRSETVNGAARARGMPCFVLWKKLRRAGAITSRGRGVTLRVPTEVIDRVLEGYVYRPRTRAA